MPSVEVAASPGFAMLATVTIRHHLYVRRVRTRSVTRLQKDQEDHERRWRDGKHQKRAGLFASEARRTWSRSISYGPIGGPGRIGGRPGELGCPEPTDGNAALPPLRPLL